MNSFKEIFNGESGGTINTRFFVPSENIIAVFVNNDSGLELTFTLQAGVDEDGDIVFYDVVDPYDGTPVTSVCTDGTTSVCMFSGVPTGVKYRMTCDSTDGDGVVIVKAYH